MTKRYGRVEFFAEEADQWYGRRNLGVQVSLKCIAVLVWRWCAGVTWLSKEDLKEEA